MIQTEMFGPTLPGDIPAEIADLFVQMAFQIKHQGFEKYSARAILHRIRWHYHVEKGQRDYKCNNIWTPTLARWAMHRHPELNGFFETRSSPGESE